MRFVKSLSIFILIFSVMTSVTYTAADEKTAKSTADMPINSDDAYIIFGSEIKQNGLSFIDDTSDANKDTYSEKVVIDGVEARKCYNKNQLYMKFNDDYVKQDDSEFIIYITYYDFCGIGWSE